MKAFVGVTDQRWYELLSADPDVNEVNFWQPSPRGVFGALTFGEPFFFKTHHPHNMLVGGGFFSGYVVMSVDAAWELYGPANGVESLNEMRYRIARYRRARIGQAEDPEIGCILLRDVRFFSSVDVVPAPDDFAKNIVRGKTYELDAGSGSSVEAALEALVEAHVSQLVRAVDGPMFGNPQLVTPRLGQKAFKALVLSAYHSRCAITGAKIRPVLEAAHIRPVAAAGEHRVDNGLLLRSDVHTLFDRGYLSVAPKTYGLQVSSMLRSMFNNGDEFYQLQGNAIRLPVRRRDYPADDMLEWHMDTVFQR